MGTLIRVFAGPRRAVLGYRTPAVRACQGEGEKGLELVSGFDAAGIDTVFFNLVMDRSPADAQ